MIEVRALTKRHGQLEVLRGIDFSLAPGEVVSLIGPSGGGKSTFLRTLNGLTSYDGGTIHVEGQLLPPRPDTRTLVALRRRVGMVFQQFHLFPHLSVLENVIEAPLRVAGLSRRAAVARAEALLAQVAMDHKLDARPHQLSGGQQQRVAIARALAMEPRVILFDEPTSALDPLMASEVSDVMRALALAGQAMVVVTHSLSLARQLGGRVLVLAEGRVVESGPAAQVLEAPQHAVTQAFVRSHVR